MALVKVFFLIATVWTLAYSAFLEDFYFYRRFAWRFCPNHNTIIEERYKEVFKTAQKCYGEFSQSNRSICHSFELHLQRCSQPLVDFFVDCLPEKSKGIPPAALKAAASVVETFCASSGEVLLELSNTCLYEYLDQRNRTIKAECSEGVLQTKIDKFKQELPSISGVCDIGREIGDCWQEYVNQDCGSLKARELFSKFYNAVLSACSKI